MGCDSVLDAADEPRLGKVPLNSAAGGIEIYKKYLDECPEWVYSTIKTKTKGGKHDVQVH